MLAYFHTLKAQKLVSNGIRQAGLTLLELLVVIAIVSILASIAIMQYQQYRVQAFDTAAKTDLRNAMAALEKYFLENDQFPPNEAAFLAADFKLSPNVELTKYNPEGVNKTIHIHVQRDGSPNEWHANYPNEGSSICRVVQTGNSCK